MKESPESPSSPESHVIGNNSKRKKRTRPKGFVEHIPGAPLSPMPAITGDHGDSGDSRDSSFVPFHRPSIGREEGEALQRVLASGWLTTGPEAMGFERDFCAFVGSKYAFAVNSATAALQLALDAIGLGPGDEVLVPTYTFTATAAVVVHQGGRPVLCDSVPGEFNIDVTDAERRITPRTRAIIPVHIAGEPCNMEAVRRLAARNNLAVIEDAAHALPARYQGRQIGTLSEFTAFSFYATKTITTGEGGMLATENADYARRIAQMRLHGISADAWKRYAREGSWYYEVEAAGYKLNMPDILAALGRTQLAKCRQFWTQRCEIARRYTEAFHNVVELETPPRPAAASEHSWHLYILRLRPGLLTISRNQFIEELKKAGIGASVHFIPLHLHPFYQREYQYRMHDFPAAEDAYARCISLPIFPGLTETEVERVIDGVTRIVISHRAQRLVAA